MSWTQPNICRNKLCKINYPHKHVKRPGLPDGWAASIDDPAEPASWPDRLKWQGPLYRRNGHGVSNLFRFGWFASHSGFQLPWKLDLEKLDGDDWVSIAELIAWKFAFRSAYGIPRGGERLARALDKHCERDYPVLIVDDVLTTGRSMEEARARLNLLNEPCIGVVVVARGPCPNWVFPILTVNEFFQSRATGLG